MAIVIEYQDITTHAMWTSNKILYSNLQGDLEERKNFESTYIMGY